MKTYEYGLIRNNITRAQIIRAESLETAMTQLESDLEEGWAIESVTENGRKIALPPSTSEA